MITWPAKDPLEVLDFAWTVPLDSGDTIASRTASVSAGSITIDSSAVSGSSVVLWISGGAADEVALVSLTATTTNGRTFREAASLPVINRAAELLADFRLRYPAFANIDDGQIAYWLAKAGVEVGGNWPSAAIFPAKTALAAHRMVETGALKSAVAAGLTSFRSGDFAATVDSAVAARTGFAATIYGREFARLRRIHFGGPIPAWTPPANTDA